MPLGLAAARRRFDRAIYCLQRAADLDDTYPEVHLKIAQACWEKGDLERLRASHHVRS